LNNKTLLEKIGSIKSLNNAWTLLNKENEYSHGLSGVTIKQFRKDIKENISKLSLSLLKDKFEFSPTRAAFRKKDNGDLRPLQIPEIKDRVVLKAIALQMEKEFDEVLNKSEGISFAYQKGKGVREAVIQMKIEYDKGNSFILKADIIKFFEKIDKYKLINSIVLPNLSDNSIDKLISSALRQKLGGLNRINRKYRKIFDTSGKGIPQGNPLSPLLSNIYLIDFDVFTKQHGMSMIRYSDDFVVLFKSEEEAINGYHKIHSFLKEKYELEIHPIEEKNVNAKTQIINPQKSELYFLSVKFDGKKLYPGRDKVGILKSKITKTIKGNRSNQKLIEELNNTIDKWVAIHSYLDIDRYFDKIDIFVQSQLKKHVKKGDFAPMSVHDLAKRRRLCQMNKNKSSFWKRPELLKILPHIFKSKLSPPKFNNKQNL